MLSGIWTENFRPVCRDFSCAKKTFHLVHRPRTWKAFVFFVFTCASVERKIKSDARAISSLELLQSANKTRRFSLKSQHLSMDAICHKKTKRRRNLIPLIFGFSFMCCAFCCFSSEMEIPAISRSFYEFILIYLFFCLLLYAFITLTNQNIKSLLKDFILQSQRARPSVERPPSESPSISLHVLAFIVRCG